MPDGDRVHRAARSVAPDEPDPSQVAALVAMLRFHGIPTEPGQIAQSLGTPTPAPRDMVRQLRERGLRARLTVANKDRLPSIPLPALTVHHDGTCILLAKLSGDRDVNSGSRQPTAGHPANGRLPRELDRASDPGCPPRGAWRSWSPVRHHLVPVGAMHKYRRILGEVLVASFFLQLFALVSPLFFQVVIDKVLVHRGMATLDVLVVGLVAIALFEALLGGAAHLCVLPTPPTASTSSLARGCSAICSALPIAVFPGPPGRRFASRACASWKTSATS